MYRSSSPTSHSSHGWLSCAADPARWLLILVACSLGLNLVLAGVLWTAAWEPTVQANAGGAPAVGGASAAALAADLTTWKVSHATIHAQFETLKDHFVQLQTNHAKVRHNDTTHARETATDRQGLHVCWSYAGCTCVDHALMRIHLLSLSLHSAASCRVSDQWWDRRGCRASARV